MIAFWNRREILVTLDMKRFNQVRELLENQGIAYDYRTKSTGTDAGPWAGNVRAKRGSFGEKQVYSLEYHIFVHKKDYEKAQYEIRQQE